MNCWEFLNCGYEEGGHNARLHGICPAYPNFGRTCARVPCTHCGDKLQGVFAAKLAECIHCAFYRSPYYDRAYASPTCGPASPPYWTRKGGPAPPSR